MTGHGAALTTSFATEPNSSRSNPARPCVPMTMRSAPFSSASFTSSSEGRPTRITPVTSMPGNLSARKAFMAVWIVSFGLLTSFGRLLMERYTSSYGVCAGMT